MTDHVVLESDGVTVWVNSATHCVARFGRYGIDIHRGIDEMAAGAGQCLMCTHGATTAEDWLTFQREMLRLYGVVVGDNHRPVRL